MTRIMAIFCHEFLISPCGTGIDFIMIGFVMVCHAYMDVPWCVLSCPTATLEAQSSLPSVLACHSLHIACRRELGSDSERSFSQKIACSFMICCWVATASAGWRIEKPRNPEKGGSFLVTARSFYLWLVFVTYGRLFCLRLKFGLVFFTYG